MSTNPNLVKSTAGIKLDITFTGTNKEMIQQVIDLVASEERGTTEQRQRLDGMLPDTRDHLWALLTALKTAVEDAE